MLTIETAGMRTGMFVGGMPGILGVLVLLVVGGRQELKEKGEGERGYGERERGDKRTYSQGTSLVCVKLTTNSSTTRSIPTVRLMSSSAVSSGLFHINWCR